MAGPLLLRSRWSSSKKSFSSPSSSPLSHLRTYLSSALAFYSGGMDRLLRQCGADIPHERAMDSLSLERERGITIASKVTMMEKDFYLGRMLTGRVSSGFVCIGDKVHGPCSIDSGTEQIEEGKKVLKLMKKKGTSMVLIDSAGAGDSISIAGMTKTSIGHTGANTELSSLAAVPSSRTLEESVKAAVEAKDYQQIPELLISNKEPCQNMNPFSFLSSFAQNRRIQIIDEILQSFIPLRPRSRPQLGYDCLLFYTLWSPQPLPLALAILQRTLRSGCLPAPQTHLLLSSVWLERRGQSQSVSDILLGMQSIGYHPDCGTCNYLLASLCAVDQLVEAVKVLKGMGRAGCVPDLESYSTVIGAMSKVRRTKEAVEMMKEMVAKVRLMPRQGTVVKVAAALRANREMLRAVEVIEFLETEGCHVGFESYELVVEGCLDCHEYILAGRIVMRMTGRGFIPYIRVRQKVVDGLASVGEWKLACVVRQRFAELGS